MLQIKRYKAEDLNATAYNPSARKGNTTAEASQIRAMQDRKLTNQVRQQAQKASQQAAPKSEKPKTSSERYIRAKTERVQETQRAKAKKTQLKKPGANP